VVKAAAKPAGRPREFDMERALDRAMHVFWAKGYEGASLQDLTTAMGIRPASLYKAFGNKQALFEQALARYLSGPVAFIRAALGAPTAYAVAEKILRGAAEFLTETRVRRGCMTIQADLVGGAETVPVRKKLISLRVKGQDELRRRFEQAKASGDLPKEADAGDLARWVTVLFQGMTVQAINGASRKELLRLCDLALRAWPGRRTSAS
jgi:AcrR family transcriptional regulator